MKQKHKYILLGILLIILIYIWWGNFKLFTTSSSYYKVNEIPAQQSIEKHSQSQPLEFKKPVLNPFKHPSVKNEQPPQPKVIHQPPKSTIPKLSHQYTIKGFIWDTELPQVIVYNKTSTTILSVHDSLENWTLSSLTDSSAIFNHEKEYDTLYLQF